MRGQETGRVREQFEPAEIEIVLDDERAGQLPADLPRDLQGKTTAASERANVFLAQERAVRGDILMDILFNGLNFIHVLVEDYLTNEHGFFSSRCTDLPFLRFS